MNIHQRLSYFFGILVFKCLNNQAPNYLTELINYVTDHQTYYTRSVSNNLLLVPCFHFAGSSLWNTIPLNITKSYFLSIPHVFQPIIKSFCMICDFCLFVYNFFYFFISAQALFYLRALFGATRIQEDGLFD